MSDIKGRILIVDDDQDALDQVQWMLKDEGLELTVAGGREEAEEALLMGQPDVAILDLMMEEADAGFVLCHQIKRMYPETRVVILTAAASATKLDFSAPLGEDGQSWIKADAFLDKPVRREKLLNEIHRLLGRTAEH